MTHSRCRRVLPFAVWLGMALLASGAAAQTVQGRVVEEGTGQPLAGAYLLLQDSAGDRVTAALAGETGQFVLRAPRPGVYRLVAQFIGYRDASTELFRLEAGQSLERDLHVAVRAVSLEGVRAEVGERCRSRPGRGPRTARLWEEARKALEITGWTESQAALRFRIVEHVRELDARSLRVTGMRERNQEGWYNTSPYRSLDPDRLDSHGYVQPVAGGQWDHFGPDADVLLSDAFLESHCFSVADSRDPELVGLAFEPVPGRDVPDIEGVLWLERGTAELRHLDFQYVNLPYPHGDWDQLGGRIEWERLATGMWVIGRWHVRMPHRATRTPGFGGRPELVLESLVQEGAEVVEVRTVAGEVLAEATGATLYGVVEDSATGRPLVDATVRLESTERTATTDAEGAYRLNGLPAGTFTVRISHPDLQLLGGGRLDRVVTLEAGRATRLAARPSLARLAAGLCARHDPDVRRDGRTPQPIDDPVVLYGFVRAPATEQPVPGALVRVLVGEGTVGERRVMSDSAGGYALCLDRPDSLAVAAVGAADAVRSAGSLDLQWVSVGQERTLRQDLSLDPGLLASAEAPGRTAGRRSQWSNALVGTVLSHESGAPIGGAMVVVRDSEGRAVHSSVTDDDGRFRFVHPDPALRHFRLTVEHVGYGSVTEPVEFDPGEQLDVEVVLAERAIELEPLTVTARRRGLLADLGFYQRMERGNGLFIERDEIERRAPARVTDLMHGKSGWRIHRTPDGKQDVRLQAALRIQGDCQPAIWIDGVLARSAGEPRVRRTPTGGLIYTQPQLSEIISPEQIEGIEVYRSPAAVPQQYGGTNASCGVVLIWTRRGGG